MASDRTTLANILEELKRADEYLTKEYYDRPNPTPHRVRNAWNAIWYCEGRLIEMLADPLPPIAAVDEANESQAQGWD